MTKGTHPTPAIIHGGLESHVVFIPIDANVTPAFNISAQITHGVLPRIAVDVGFLLPTATLIA